jgi:hypothetical protein
MVFSPNLFARNSCQTLRSFLGGSHIAATFPIFVLLAPLFFAG